MVGGRNGSVRVRGGGRTGRGSEDVDKDYIGTCSKCPSHLRYTFLNISFHHQSSHIPFFNTRQSLLPLSL